MGYTPYVLVIAFENGNLHAATAVKIEGEYFVLDQHPPLLDLPTYYKYWAYYSDHPSYIANATFYKIELEEKNVSVTRIGVYDLHYYMDHYITSYDLKKIQSDVAKFIENKYPIELDPSLEDLDVVGYLPWGYVDGRTWKITLAHYADYYNPAAHEHYVKCIFNKLMNYEEWKDSKKYGKFFKDFSNSNRFWIKIKENEDDLVVVFNLARQIYGY